MIDNLKENIKPWIFVIIFTIACALTVTVATRCSKNDSLKATVTLPKIKIYIKGEINKPGLYELDADKRLSELIKIAGGQSKDADLEKINLAAQLRDGTTVIIPKIGSEEEIPEEIAQTESYIYSAEYKAPTSSGNDKITSGTINLNSAGVSELMRLPGVGESTANKIIDYRKANGDFKAIEEIMNVSGIGEAKFEKMKQFITVN